MNANNVEVRERPILYSAPMVRAVLDGTKTQTRRVIKGPKQAYPKDHWDIISGRYVCWPGDEAESYPLVCPYGKPGDQLWVRETFWAYGHWEQRYSGKKKRNEWHFVDQTLEMDRLYQYSDPTPESIRHRRNSHNCWWKRPAIHMPRVASRILLEIVSVRVERLHDISSKDAIAEGIEDIGKVLACFKNYEADHDYRDDKGRQKAGIAFNAPIPSFASLWRSINGSGSWDANPFVWVIEFKRVDATAERGVA